MKKQLEIVLLGVFLFLMILPGIVFIDILGHELYHVIRHRDYVQSVCFSVVDGPVLAQTVIHLPSNVTNSSAYGEQLIAAEELQANRAGRLLSISYLVFALIIILWVLTIIKRHER